MNSPRLVYVYHIYECDALVYVGITYTTTKRHKEHIKRGTVLSSSIIEVIHSTHDKNDACQLEKSEIQKYGRLDIGTGILRNNSNGGESGAVGIRVKVTCPSEQFITTNEEIFGTQFFNGIPEAEHWMFGEGDSTRRMMNMAIENKNQTGTFRGYIITRNTAEF